MNISVLADGYSSFCIAGSGMTCVILVMDNDEGRLTAMRSLLTETYPDYEIMLFHNAPDTIELLKENFSSVVFILLHHDLGPNKERNSEVFDLGTGSDAVDYFATQTPVCPVLMHTTNYMG